MKQFRLNPNNFQNLIKYFPGPENDLYDSTTQLSWIDCKGLVQFDGSDFESIGKNR